MSKVTTQKNITCTDAPFPPCDTTIDVVSFDIGTINMGVARVRYDYTSHRLCVLNAMLLNIFHPFQRLNENDAEHDKDTTFPVSAYYAAATLTDIVAENRAFSQQQLLCRKRARVCENTEHALQFATDMHPSGTAKRRHTKFNQSQIPATLADNWALIGAQLSLAIEAHRWMSQLDDIDFILIEQQDRANPKARAISLALVTFFETKRHLQPLSRRRPQTHMHEHAPTGSQPLSSPLSSPLVTLGPFIKICSASNKLAHSTTRAMRQNWSIVASRQSTAVPTLIAEAQVKAVLKKHFHPPQSSVADTSNYAKRKISSKDEMTAFFCRPIIERARALAAERHPVLPETCDEDIVKRVAHEPVNAYAHWIVNQLGAKNNVTDALLQAFSWLEQCQPPANPDAARSLVNL